MRYKYLLLFIILLGCNPGIKEASICKRILTHELCESGKVKKFHLPSSVLCYSINMQIYEDSLKKEWLYFLGRENKILKYDLSDEKLTEQIEIQQRGPDEVGIATGFRVIRLDSIMVTSKFSKKLYFLNRKGRKIYTIPFGNDTLNPSTTRCNQMVSIFTDRDALYIPQSIEGNWNYLPIKEFEKYRTTLKIDINSGKLTKTGMALPFKSSEYKMKSMEYSVVKIEKGYLYSFSGSDNIFLTKDFEKFKVYSCRSSNVYGELANYLGSEDVQKIMRKQVQSCSYGNLVWDPYRKLVYRFYQIGVKDLKANDDLFNIRNYPPSFGIMVLDQNLNIIADQILSHDKYFFNNYFVSREGLFLSINHPSNPNMDYNYLSFELITIKQKQ